MTRDPAYPFTGLFLSELAATGRTSVTVRCDRCAHARTVPLADLIAEHGDVVMPDALGRITAGCPKRHELGVSYARCSAVYADPATPAEVERIKAMRPPEPARDPRRGRW